MIFLKACENPKIALSLILSKRVGAEKVKKRSRIAWILILKSCLILKSAPTIKKVREIDRKGVTLIKSHTERDQKDQPNPHLHPPPSLKTL